MYYKHFLWAVAVFYIGAGIFLLYLIGQGNDDPNIYPVTFMMFGCGAAVLFALYLVRDKNEK